VSAWDPEIPSVHGSRFVVQLALTQSLSELGLSVGAALMAAHRITARLRRELGALGEEGLLPSAAEPQPGPTMPLRLIQRESRPARILLLEA
jgi:hypothetical protein